MSAFEHWQQQREPLRAALSEQDELAGVVYQLRHALLQTEQNMLSELSDDVLRQQIGVLFSSLKTSAGLLTANVATKVWMPQSQKNTQVGKNKVTLWVIAVLIQVFCGLVCYFKGLWLGWTLALAVLIIGSVALIMGHKKSITPSPTMDEVRVTLRPDTNGLLNVLDAQLSAIDRYANDFAYLNEQLRGDAEHSDSTMLARMTDLLEALYECDEESRAPAEEAVKQMLANMGLHALNYSDESRRLFTALPSKSETRTLSPAIVSSQDGKLLKRGTAAVKMNVAS